MDYISIKEAAIKFNISERRVQKLCEQKRIEGATMISNVWLIPSSSQKPNDARLQPEISFHNLLSLKEFCKELSISTATGKNWIRLNKITPTQIIKRIPCFSIEYTNNLKNQISSGSNTALKSRRNKKFVSGNCIYKSYIDDNSPNIKFAQNIIDNMETCSVTDENICLIIAEYSLRLLNQSEQLGYSYATSYLYEYLANNIQLDARHILIDALISNIDYAIDFINQYPQLFSVPFVYVPKEDTLGLLYISLKNIGSRKATGAYYTPTKVVKSLVSSLNLAQTADATILDPCCGTGNFLLQLPNELPLSNVFGNDIDTISVKITRINLAIQYHSNDIETICKNVTISDYLLTENIKNYTYIIGNPPWGFDFDESISTLLKSKYECAIGKNTESYDVFIEQSLNQLNDDGTVSFVLPEALLNVKTHTPIREIIMKRCSIDMLMYLGNAFNQVQCPCIIMQLRKTNAHISCLGMKIIDSKSEFTINRERTISSDCFSFSMNDLEYAVLNKVLTFSNCTTLSGNADFALGIVTGNNNEYITQTKNSENEMILKGSDICKYNIKATKNYITFAPDKYQQIAPTEYYRAPEKLLYRFISEQLVFAYDNKQTLSLNSCNIVIPHIKELSIKYILAILNSRMAQFIYCKHFNSIKLLRSHIEKLPLPIVSESSQKHIVTLVDQLLDPTVNNERLNIYNQLDFEIAKLFDLTNDEYSVILKSLENYSLFID